MSFGRVRIQAVAQSADFAGGEEVPGRCDSRSGRRNAKCFASSGRGEMDRSLQRCGLRDEECAVSRGEDQGSGVRPVGEDGATCRTRFLGRLSSSEGECSSESSAVEGRGEDRGGGFGVMTGMWGRS